MTAVCDFHIHSCVSPCGALSMPPSAIASILKQKGVTLAALTDHNTALNCPAFKAVCAKEGIAALYGMEVQTAEEVHVLTLFSDLDTALLFGQEIYTLLPNVMHVPGKMGDQVYVDENDVILGSVEKFLITSADITLDRLAERVHELDGLVIPAHIDRSSFSLLSQLGFIPDGQWDALEIFNISAEKLPDTRQYPVISSSDAHYPEHIAQRTFELDTGSLPLTDNDGRVILDTVRAALLKRICA